MFQPTKKENNKKEVTLKNPEKQVYFNQCYWMWIFDRISQSHNIPAFLK